MNYYIFSFVYINFDDEEKTQGNKNYSLFIGRKMKQVG